MLSRSSKVLARWPARREVWFPCHFPRGLNPDRIPCAGRFFGQGSSGDVQPWARRLSRGAQAGRITQKGQYETPSGPPTATPSGFVMARARAHLGCSGPSVFLSLAVSLPLRPLAPGSIRQKQAGARGCGSSLPSLVWAPRIEQRPVPMGLVTNSIDAYVGSARRARRASRLDGDQDTRTDILCTWALYSGASHGPYCARRKPLPPFFFFFPLR